MNRDPLPSTRRLLRVSAHLQHVATDPCAELQADWGPTIGWNASGKGGAVAAGGAGAVACGMTLLKQGGNAADAAAATLLGLASGTREIWLWGDLKNGFWGGVKKRVLGRGEKTGFGGI